MTLILPGDEPTATQLNAAYPKFVRKTADETVNNSAVLQNDDELVLAVAASTTYKLELRLIINTGTTPDLKVAWSIPVGLTMTLTLFESWSPSVYIQGPYTQASTIAINGSAGGGGDQTIIIEGLVIVSTTAGNLQLMWAQNTANASNSSVKTNSYMVLNQLS